MVRKPSSAKINKEEVAELRRRLEEAEQTLSAIQNGEVDALVVTGDTGDQVYTLKSAERPYRVMIEQMSEGALTLSPEGIILYCNESFARMVKLPQEEVVATSVYNYLDPASRSQFQSLVKYGGKGEIILRASDRTRVTAYAALSPIQGAGTTNYSLVVTDLSEHIHTEQIIASERFARILLEQAADLILVCDTRGKVIRSSEKAFSFFGENPTGRPLDRIFSRLYLQPGSSNPEDRLPIKFSSIQKAEIPSGSEVISVSDNKPGRNLLLNFSRIAEGESILGYSISLVDITERKRLEESLQRYTTELESANQELEAFSYSVSHDLRAPLRALDSFSQLVSEDYADKLDETGKDYLNRVRKASQFMSELIDDMLKLSRITRTDMYRDQVDLSEIVQSILDELKAAQPERQADLIIAPELTASGDRPLLTIALRNLLENAWKFTRKRPRTRIEVGVTQKDGANVYFIKDNGSGFDMRYADKLFQPFQRLHTDKDFEGTGIGLAIVQRIIRRHGGKIWAESEKDRGTAFYFTLE